MESDIGLYFVMRKDFLTSKQQTKDDWLSTNAFHTMCTIGDRFCKLIIDSGNYENVVSEEDKNKLNLKWKYIQITINLCGSRKEVEKLPMNVA